MPQTDPSPSVTKPTGAAKPNGATRLASVSEITVGSVRIAVFFAALAICFEAAYLFGTASFTLVEMLALPICLFVVAPLVLWAAKRSKGDQVSTSVKLAFWFAFAYILGGLVNGLLKDDTHIYGLHYITWMVVPFIFVAATHSIRQAQIICWSAWSILVLVCVGFLVIEQRSPHTDPLALVLVQSMAALAAILALIYLFSLYRERNTANRMRVEILKEHSATLERAAQDAEAARAHAELARAQAEAAMKVRDQFLANMSHELRTPLNAIIGFSDVLEREMYGPHGDKRYGEYATDIRTSGEHLLGIINQILDYAKQEDSQSSLHMEPLNLGEIIADTCRIMQLAAAEKGLALNWADKTTLPVIVDGDRQALRQVLLNLLSNAIKFTKQGSVTVELSRAGKTTQLVIADTGIGMAQADIEQLFEPFYRSAQAYDEQIDGTGLGLSIVENLLAAHHGTIEVESAPGQGTRMIIFLPLAAKCPGKAEIQSK